MAASPSAALGEAASHWLVCREMMAGAADTAASEAEDGTGETAPTGDTGGETTGSSGAVEL